MSIMKLTGQYLFRELMSFEGFVFFGEFVNLVMEAVRDQIFKEVRARVRSGSCTLCKSRGPGDQFC